MKILVTGCAGFIGSHLSEKLLQDKTNIVYGIDNINDYYDKSFKLNNLKILEKYNNFTFSEDDICNTDIISIIKPNIICHLASFAGVRFSIENPKIYIKNNIEGFVHIMEESVKNNVSKIIYASSSSVYGLTEKLPFNEKDRTDSCNSPYAASKLSMEIFAKTYFQLYKIKSIGFRFFTVYGPRCRPDMAPYKFLYSLEYQKKFNKYGSGESSRDYTYIDDIIDGIISAVNSDNINCEIYNLGNSNPISLNNFIKLGEKVTGKKAKFEQIEDQLGDVPHTYADINKAKRDLNYNPKTSLEVGLRKTLNWIKEWNNK